VVRGKKGEAAQARTVGVGKGKETLVGRGKERAKERVERAGEVRKS
jgi:hypothetical protein